MEKILDDIRRDAHAKLKGENGGIKELTDAINTIVQLLRKAHYQGIPFFLDDWAENTRSRYLRYVLMLVRDLHSLEEIVELGANAYWKDDPQGVQAMVDYIYLKGTIAIMEADSPQKVLETLLGILPPDSHWQIEEQMVQYIAEPERRFFQIRPVFRDADQLEQIAELEKEMGLLSDHALYMFMENFEDFFAHDLVDCVYALMLNRELCERFLACFNERSQSFLKRRVVNKYDVGDRSHVSIAGTIFCMKALREREEALTTRKEEVEKAERLLEEIRQDAMEKLKSKKDGLKELKRALEMGGSAHGWGKQMEHALSEIQWSSGMVLGYGLHKLRDYNFSSEFLGSIARQVVDEVRPELIIRNVADAYWMDEPEGVQAMVNYIYLRGMIRIRQGNIYNFFCKELENLLPKE